MLIKQNQLVINGTTLEQSDLQAIANVASDVQAQIDTKAPINNAQFTGNIGIGTDNPSDKLEVSRASTDQTVGLTLTNIQNGGYGSGIVWKSKRSDNSNVLTAAEIVVTGENSWNSDSTTSSQIQFKTQKDNTLTHHMTLTKNGNLGIGTPTPSAPLSIEFSNNNGGVGGLLIKNSNTGTTSNFSSLSTQAVNGTIQGTFGSAYYSTWGGAGTFAGSQTGHPFRIITSNAVRATVDASGYVGIGGNHAPVEPLDLRFVGRHGVIVGSTNGNGSYIVLDGAGNGDAAGSDYAYIEHTSSGNLNFNVGNGSNSTNTKMLIEPGGNVGIGTANSSYKLDISGVGAEQLRLKSSGDTGYTQGAMIIESSDSSSNPGNRGQGVYYYNVPNQRTWYTGTLYNNGNKFGFGYRQVSGFQDDAADNLHAVMVIDGDSKEVGIGVTNPSATLHVEDDGTGGNSGHMKIGHTRTRTFYAGISSSENRWYKVLNYSGGNMFTGKIQIYITRNGGYNQTGAHKEYRASLGGYSNNIYGPLSLSGDGGEGGVASLEVGTDAGIYLRVNSSIYGGTVYVTFSGQGGMSWAYSNSSYSTSLP